MKASENGNKRRRVSIKKRVKKASSGAISILLCLLLTPFMTISLGLVEYARYQELISIVDELYELTGLSILADYDTYIHDRFGLLAVNQDRKLNAQLGDLLYDNMGVVGKQAAVENASAKGVTSLAEMEVLRQQVVNFSELTVPTSVLMDDFNLEELLEKLKTVEQFTNIMDTVSDLAEATEHLTEAVEIMQEIHNKLSELSLLIESTILTAENLAIGIADLYARLDSEGISLPQGASPEAIEAAVSAFREDFLEDIKGLYADAKGLLDGIDSAVSLLVELVGEGKNDKDALIWAAIDAVNKATEALESVNTQNAADEDGEISESMMAGLDDILTEMEDLIENTLIELQETTLQAAKDALNEIADTLIEDTGLAEITTRYALIVDGDYFESAEGKQDIIDLLQTVYEVCRNSGGEDLYQSLINYFYEKFVPDFHFDIGAIAQKIGNILESAGSNLKDDIGDSIWSTLSKLVNIVKSMFSLNVFFDEELNAFVDLDASAGGGYDSFLVAIGNLFTAIEKFGLELANWDLLGGLSALGEMLDAVVSMLGAIFEVIGDMFSSLYELFGATFTGDVRALYEKLLISGYMTHNLPNRTSAAYTSYDKAENAMVLELSGEGLTNFEYNDIARPSLYSGQNGGKTTLQELGGFITNLQSGNGTDTMFMGAELEYIRAGTKSEIVNQTICFLDMYFLRMLVDLPAIFTNTEVTAIASATTVAAWVVYILYILAEPFLDTVLLVNGADVALLKGKCWLTPSGVVPFAEALLEATVAHEGLREEINGALGESMESFAQSFEDIEAYTGKEALSMSYDSHMLLILFIFVESDEQLDRLQDLIKLETAQYYRNTGGTFSIFETYTAVEISGDLTINTLLDFGLLTGEDSLVPQTHIKQVVGY